MVSLPTPKCPGVTQGSPGVVWLVLGVSMGTSTPKGAGVEAVLPRMARVSQEWPWVSRETPCVFRKWPWMTEERPWMSWWGEASVGASLRVSRGGEASDGASPCESKGQTRGVPGWWS